jgi:hypothetical protein
MILIALAGAVKGMHLHNKEEAFGSILFYRARRLKA